MMAYPRSYPLHRRLASIPLFWVITVPLVVSALGTVAGAGYLAYRNGQRAVDDLGQQLVSQTNALIHQELENYLETPRLINRLNGDTVMGQGGLAVRDSTVLEATLIQRLQQFEAVTGLSFASPDGTLRVVERYPDGRLVVANPAQPNQVIAYRLGPDGQRGPEIERWSDGDLRRDHAWYAQAVARGTLGWNPIFLQQGTNYLTLSALQPLYDPNSQALLGVFAVHLRLDYLSDMLRSLDLSQEGRILITDDQGTILATSTAALPYTLVGGSGASQQFRQYTLATSPDQLIQALSPHLQAGHLLRSLPTENPTFLATPTTHTFSFRYQGAQQLVSVSAFQDGYGLDWRIVTVMPESYFLGELPQQQRNALLLWLLGLTNALGLGLVAAKLLLNRLARFNQASQQLAAGDLTQRLPTDSPIAELNGLAVAFNQMADQLQQSFQHIQTALTESETKFATIFRTSPDPIAIATLSEGRIVEANQSLLAFFGYTWEELVGRTALDLNLWTNLDQRDQCRTRLIQQRRLRNLEVELQNQAGVVKTVLLSAEVQPLAGEDCVIVALRDISDRKQTEAQLRQTEQWLEQYSQLSPGKIYTLVQEPDGHLWFEYISSAVETINEVTAQAVLANGQIIFDMFHPEDVAGYEAAALESMQTLTPFSHQWRIITPSGQIKWVQDYAQPTRSETGAIIWHGVVIDISERARLEAERKHSEAQRQRVELALQASETRFRQLAETVQEGFFVYETESNHYSYVNPAYWVICGLDPKNDSNRMAQWLSHIHPDDRDRIEMALERERQGENFDQEYRYITPSGERRWLRSKAFPLCNGIGNVVRIVGTVENITDRKDAETELRQSEERFRSVFHYAPYGISLVSPTGQFVMANAYYCNLLGYSEAELLALTFKDITHPDDWDNDWVGFQRMMAGELSNYRVEKRYLTKQGEAIPVIINAAPIYDATGQPLYSVGHVQDIRDRLAIDRMKDEFISIVSHELRTPITSIQGALALLGAGVYEGRPEKAKAMLTIAINNSDRLVRLVDDILSFERLESGKVQLEKEFCSIADLMHQAIDSVQTIADQAHITLSVHPIPARIWAAPDAIGQTLTNLLSNAIKFSSPGSTVWLRATLDSDPQTLEHKDNPTLTDRERAIPYPPASPDSSTALPTSPQILFIVQDQGRGIPADKLERIFEQFQQVDVSDSRQRGGTGLGLAICKRIVEQHQGRIWVKSQLGQGSQFYVALPLGDAPYD